MQALVRGSGMPAQVEPKDSVTSWSSPMCPAGGAHELCNQQTGHWGTPLCVFSGQGGGTTEVKKVWL